MLSVVVREFPELFDSAIVPLLHPRDVCTLSAVCKRMGALCDHPMATHWRRFCTVISQLRVPYTIRRLHTYEMDFEYDRRFGALNWHERYKIKHDNYYTSIRGNTLYETYAYPVWHNAYETTAITPSRTNGPNRITLLCGGMSPREEVTCYNDKHHDHDTHHVWTLHVTTLLHLLDTKIADTVLGYLSVRDIRVLSHVCRGMWHLILHKRIYPTPTAPEQRMSASISRI